jgi:hypothetical protein
MIGVWSDVGPTTQLPRPRPLGVLVIEDDPECAEALPIARAGPPGDATRRRASAGQMLLPSKVPSE